MAEISHIQVLLRVCQSYSVASGGTHKGAPLYVLRTYSLQPQGYSFKQLAALYVVFI